MKNNSVIVASMVLFMIFYCIPATADNAMVNENKELKQRIDKLEKELSELKTLVLKQAEAEKMEKAPAEEKKPSTMPELSKADMDKIMEMVEKGMAGKKPVWSGLDIQLYGYLKADASYDTARTTTGNYVVYVDRNSDNDDEFNITANQTRLGMKITGPEKDGIKTSGIAEIDFYGSDAEENKAKIQMRHAYLQIDWLADRFSVLAGQTSDVFSPLNPNTLNYTVLWDCGNIGYRHPQIRVTKNMPLNDNVDMKLEGAIARTIGDSETITKSGEDAGFPTFQGRVGFTFPWLEYKPTTVGFSGHWGEEEYDSSSTVATSEKFYSWSLNFDIHQPISKLVAFKAEAFCGKNLDNYFGGIGQGVSTTTAGTVTTYHREIGSRGGWMALELTPESKWSFNLGMGMDDVENDDINTGQRAKNLSVFGNAIYSLNQNTQVGFELSKWRTDYIGGGDADDLRAQTSFIYKF